MFAVTALLFFAWTAIVNYALASDPLNRYRAILPSKQSHDEGSMEQRHHAVHAPWKYSGVACKCGIGLILIGTFFLLYVAMSGVAEIMWIPLLLFLSAWTVFPSRSWKWQRSKWTFWLDQTLLFSLSICLVFEAHESLKHQRNEANPLVYLVLDPILVGCLVEIICCLINRLDGGYAAYVLTSAHSQLLCSDTQTAITAHWVLVVCRWRFHITKRNGNFSADVKEELPERQRVDKDPRDRFHIPLFGPTYLGLCPLNLNPASDAEWFRNEVLNEVGEKYNVATNSCQEFCAIACHIAGMKAHAPSWKFWLFTLIFEVIIFYVTDATFRQASVTFLVAILGAAKDFYSSLQK